METKGNITIDFSASETLKLKGAEGLSFLIHVPHMPSTTGLSKAIINVKDASARIALQFGLFNLPVTVDADINNGSIGQTRLLHWIKIR